MLNLLTWYFINKHFIIWNNHGFSGYRFFFSFSFRQWLYAYGYKTRLNWICCSMLMHYNSGPLQCINTPESKVHVANMGPTWGRQDPGGPHVGPMNLAIWDIEAETKRLNFHRQYFQIHFQFLQWNLSYLASNFTEVCSSRSNWKAIWQHWLR